MLTWSNVGKFAGGGVVGFLAIFVLVLVSGPIGRTLMSPREGSTLSAAARGGDGQVVHARRLGLDMRVRCRGGCDDIRLVQGAPSVATSPPVPGERRREATR